MSKILAPDDDWCNQIAHMWLLGRQISLDAIGETMDSGLGDLDRLQRILDGQFLSAEQTQELQALGIVFGKVIIGQCSGYDWWIVEDEYGEDPCIRFQQTSLLIFPRTMISQRIEDGKEVDVHDLYEGLLDHLAELEKEVNTQH
jgi:hypothetical protein